MLPMPDEKTPRSGSEPDREPFVTIDDLLSLAQEITTGLERLSAYKHPLEVRRGIRKGVKKRMNTDQSRQIKGGSRTYFFDVEETKDGRHYLRITESRKGKDEKFERNSINVFPEDAGEFAQAVADLASALSTGEAA